MHSIFDMQLNMYVYLYVYSLNVYSCLHCLIILCDLVLVCFALPSGSFVAVHNVSWGALNK